MSIKRFNGAGIYTGKSIKVWDQTTTLNDFQSIATIIVPSGGLGTIDFTNIPQTYTHLQLRAINQTNRASVPRDSIKMTFNGDSTSSYNSHALYGDGGSAGAYANGTQGWMEAGNTSSSTAGASIFGVQIIDILDYSNTTKNKTIRSLGGSDCNGTVNSYGGVVGFESGFYFANTLGITRITITPYSGSLFSQYSQFSLYGIKVAS